MFDLSDLSKFDIWDQTDAPIGIGEKVLVIFCTLAIIAIPTVLVLIF